MIETVTPETARAVKKAGWKRETIAHYYDEGLCWFTTSGTELNLPAPALPELLAKLSYEDLREYFIRFVLADNYPVKKWAETYWMKFAKWLYSTMRSVEALAKVWIWKTAKEKVGD